MAHLFIEQNAAYYRETAQVSALAQYEDGIAGSDQIWFAAIGPGIASEGLIATAVERNQSQIAATLLHALDIDKDQFDPAAGPAVDGDIRRQHSLRAPELSRR